MTNTTLYNWLEAASKKTKTSYLITKKVKAGNALLRKYEQNKNTYVTNVKVVSYAAIAKELFFMFTSMNMDSKCTLLTSGQAVFLLQKLLRKLVTNQADNLLFFKKEEIMNEAACAELYDKLVLLRSNGVIENQDNSDKMKDLIFLKEEYEKELKDNNQLDECMLYQYCIEQLRQCKQEDVLQLVEYYHSLNYGVLQEEYTYCNCFEQELIQTLSSQTECSQISLVDSFGANYTKSLSKAKFYRGYGAVNEISYILYDIYNNLYPYGSVAVYYTSKAQEPFLEYVFHDVPHYFAGSRAAQDSEVVQFIMNVLTWVEQDFNEAVLMKLLESPLVCGWSTYVTSPRRRFEDKFVLGWGYKRNSDFIEHEENYIKKASDETENEKASLDKIEDEAEKEKKERSCKKKEVQLAFHKSLLELFSKKANPEGYQPASVLEEIIKIIASQVNVSVAGEKRAYAKMLYNKMKGQLYDLVADLKMDTTRYTCDNMIKVLKKKLLEVTVGDAECSDAICLECLNGIVIPERKHSYLIGLSLKDVQDLSQESPVLHDSELLQFIQPNQNKLLPTILTKKQQREELLTCLWNLCDDADDATVTAGYSYYDSIEQYEIGPSVLYTKWLQEAQKSQDNLQEITVWYGNPDSGYTTLPKKSSKVLLEELKALEDSLKKQVHAVVEDTQEQDKEEMENDEDVYEDEYEAAYDEYEAEDDEYGDEVEDDEYGDEEEDDEYGDEIEDEYDEEEDVYEDEEVENVTNRQRKKISLDLTEIPDETSKSVVESRDFFSDQETSLMISASSLETFLQCPKKYYHQYVLSIAQDDAPEFDSNRWLNFADYGNYFHYMMKKCVNETPEIQTAIRSREEQIGSKHKDCLQTLSKKLNDEFVHMSPMPNEESKKIQSDEIVQMCQVYLDHLKEELGKDWHVLCGELGFDEWVSGICLNNNLHLKGSIDRVDYRIKGDTIQLRLVDYKTGKLDKKKAEYDQGKLIQPWLYAKVCECSKVQKDIKEKIKELEGNSKAKKIEVCEFTYVFPAELVSGKEDYKLPVEQDKMEAAPARFLAFLLCMNEKSEVYLSYPEIFETFQLETYQYEVSALTFQLMKNRKDQYQLASEERKSCEYCSYNDICQTRQSAK